LQLQECVPNYAAATCGPCLGNCQTASQWCTATNCPVLYSRSVGCEDQLNCFCYYYDELSTKLGPGVVTCGDCLTMSQGQSCYFQCLNQAQTLTSSGVTPVSSALCLSSGFADIPFTDCVDTIGVCPPQVSYGAVNYEIGPRSVCVGAQNGQVCRGNCFPGYYSAQAAFNSTCTCDNVGNCTWDLVLFCTSQTGCNTV
jgi:hypothetical protein